MTKQLSKYKLHIEIIGQSWHSCANFFQRLVTYKWLSNAMATSCAGRQELFILATYPPVHCDNRNACPAKFVTRSNLPVGASMISAQRCRSTKYMNEQSSLKTWYLQPYLLVDIIPKFRWSQSLKSSTVGPLTLNAQTRMLRVMSNISAERRDILS